MAVNIVPTPRVRTLAEKVLADTVDLGAGDAVARVARVIRPDEVVPLLVVLARAAIDLDDEVRPLPGFTTEDRRMAHAAYVRGVDTPLVRRGEREYQRERKRAARAGRKAAS